MAILESIKNLFMKSEEAKYYEQIQKYLKSITRKEKDLDSKIRSLTNQKALITDQQVQQIRDLYNKDYDYLRSNQVQAISVAAVAFFQREQKHSAKRLPKLNAQMVLLRNSFVPKLDSLDVLQGERNAFLTPYFQKVEQFLRIVKKLKSMYITTIHYEYLKKKYGELFTFFDDSSGKTDNVATFMAIFKDLKRYIKDWNATYIQKELRQNEAFFNDIDGKSLDLQQRTAIVTDEASNLILAGAGSGKTLTISGKVKYLVEKKNIKPEEILLISFTKKASIEMAERVVKRLGVKVDVKTFHKLGLEILAKNDQAKPEIFNSFQEVIHHYFQKEIYQHKTVIQKLVMFFGYYLTIPKSIEEFDTLGEYHEHTRDLDYETLKGKTDKQEYVRSAADELAKEYKTFHGETVKSYEEIIIANFLFLNGVEYGYERPYPHRTESIQYSQYKPDFYLPEFDLYIEHFGVNEQNRTPWLSEIEEKKYLEGMEWKRKLHEEKGTTLVETYSFYNNNGILLEKLEELLVAKGVVFKEIDFRGVFDSIFNQTKDRYFHEFIKLISSFIQLFKSNGYDSTAFDEFHKENRKQNQSPFIRKRTELFFEVVRPIFDYYQSFLQKNQYIDFNDMINLATSIVQEGKVQFPYKYIIIDEYQDISKSRYHLVDAIRRKTHAKIVCVGDDWQSIYRFAGSDIQLFTKFEQYFGHYELLKIEQTYRNSQELITIAGDFVMKNKDQMVKNLQSTKQAAAPIRIMEYQNDYLDSLKEAIAEIIAIHGIETEIMLLGRNNFDVNDVLKSGEFVKKGKGEQVEIVYKKHPNIKLFFLTTHRAKGLEADNSILLNAQNSKSGFPNKMVDDPLLSWVLTKSDRFEFAEERRLFYVAITRTKNTTYILAPENKQSHFVKELKSNYDVSVEPAGQSVQTNPQCPRCQTGHLLLRGNNGKYGSFLGCTNYPQCGYTLKNTDVLTNPKICPGCGGYMIKRRGKYGSFYGCSNFPTCRRTEKLKEEFCR